MANFFSLVEEITIKSNKKGFNVPNFLGLNTK